MKLNKILEKVSYKLLNGTLDKEVTDVIYDTRKIVPGCLFVCIKGSRFDSHDLIDEIIKKGATTIVVQKEVDVKDSTSVILVENTRNALALCSASYFNNPQEKLFTIGITGTKGKTTTAFMTKKMLEENNCKVGIIGTIGAFINDEKIETHNTTPESYELYKMFSLMLEQGCTHVVMEVSSQGLKQNRVDGIKFNIGVFTNFSEDHIGPDEHETMEEYLYYKSLLFQRCDLGLINIDDEATDELLKNSTCEILTFGSDEKADVYFHDSKKLIESDVLGTSYKVSGKISTEVKLGMPGYFNIYNSLIPLIISDILKLDLDKTLLALKTVSVRGRVEMVPVSNDYYVLIDYAHNEEEVESILSVIKTYNPKRLICLYGGGGNRAKSRRVSMGKLCGEMAYLSVLCEDNPRYEDISSINKDIIEGIDQSNGKYIEINDRKEAIHYCLDNALPGDFILLLGKGHETYQEKEGKKYYFSEKEVLNEYKNNNY